MRLIWLMLLACAGALAKKGHRHHQQRLRAQQSEEEQGDHTVVMINTDAPAHVTSPNFISLTLDPFMIRDLPWADPQTLMLAQELSPAWFKIAPTTDVLEYEQFNLTMFQWAAMTHFANESGFDQLWDAGIFARAAETWKKSLRGGELEDNVAAPSTIHDFPPRVEHMGFVSKPSDLDKIAKIQRLFPKYNSEQLKIFGPEVKFFNDYSEIEKFSIWYSHNFDRVGAVTFRPSPMIGSRNASLASIIRQESSEVFRLELLVLQETLERLGHRNTPVMISDSRFLWDDLVTTQKYRNSFGLTLLWADRLGMAAANGAHAVFHPNLLPMHDRGLRNQPSPDYWYAMLHKKLVGPRVLSIRSRSTGGALSSLYAHCTPTGGKQRYPKGSVTVVGINLGDTELIGNVSEWSDSSSEENLHQYLLTGDIEQEKIYLNGEELKSDFDSNNPVPELGYKILKAREPLVMPAHSVSFWVLPTAFAAACTDAPRRSKRSSPILDDDTTHLAIFFPREDLEAADKAFDEAPNASKEKRCFTRLLKKDEDEEAQPCPEGCTPATPLGGCGLMGLKIMAPGCSTSDILERLLYVTDQRRNGCCCDGCEHSSTEEPTAKRMDDSTDKPLVETSTTLEDLISTIFTSPQPSEEVTQYIAGGRSAEEPGTPPPPSDFTFSEASTTPALRPVEYSPPATAAAQSQESSTQTPSGPKFSQKFTFDYDPESKKIVSGYVTVPFPTSSTPLTPSTTTTTTTTTTLAPTVVNKENKRMDSGDKAPEVEKTLTTPPLNHLPYKFEGHFKGMIAPFDRDPVMGGQDFYPALHSFNFAPPEHPLPPLNDPEAVRDRHEEYLSNFQRLHPEPQPLRQTLYYPAEQETIYSPGEGLEPCLPNPFLESMIGFLDRDGAQASHEELLKSRQVLQSLQQSVELDQQHGVAVQSEGSGECLRQMSSKIKNALAILNWLKENSESP